MAIAVIGDPMPALAQPLTQRLLLVETGDSLAYHKERRRNTKLVENVQHLQGFGTGPVIEGQADLGSSFGREGWASQGYWTESGILDDQPRRHQIPHSEPAKPGASSPARRTGHGSDANPESGGQQGNRPGRVAVKKIPNPMVRPVSHLAGPASRRSRASQPAARDSPPTGASIAPSLIPVRA